MKFLSFDIGGFFLLKKLDDGRKKERETEIVRKRYKRTECILVSFGENINVSNYFIQFVMVILLKALVR